MWFPQHSWRLDLLFDFKGNVGIYKIRKDGSDNTLIVNSQMMGLAVVNDWIYYVEK